MGVVKGIDADHWPKQGKHLNKDVKVCFNYDTSKTTTGRIVRDDISEPGVGIIELKDGRYLLMTECHYIVLE